MDGVADMKLLPTRMTKRLVAIAVVVGAASGAAAASAAIVANVNKSPSLNSNESRMTDAQRNALYQQGLAESGAFLQSWYAHLNPAALNLRNLQRVGMLANFAPPQAPTLKAAVAQAEVVVAVTVTDIRTRLVVGAPPGAPPESFVTVRVDSRVKGATASSIVLHQAGGLIPSAGTGAPRIEDADPAPILLPGDRAVVMLIADAGAAGNFLIENYTGEYRIDAGGKVSALPQNPFAAQVAGLTETTFLSSAAAATSA